MIIHEIRITASPDDRSKTEAYVWKVGDDLDDLDKTLDLLMQYLTLRRDTLRTALMSQQPMP